MTNKKAECYALITDEYAKIAASSARITELYLDAAKLEQEETGKPVRKITWRGWA